MYSLKKHAVTLGLLLTISAFPALTVADSGVDAGASPSVSANLNLRVSIPEFLFFRVGSVGSTDTITFDMTNCVTLGTCEVGDGTAQSGTGGDASGSGANVRVLSNAGTVDIEVSNDAGAGGLGTGGLSLTEIGVESDNSNLDTPNTAGALTNAGLETVSVTATGNITDEVAVWTYSYLNTTVPDPGDYDAVLTYTATTP